MAIQILVLGESGAVVELKDQESLKERIDDPKSCVWVDIPGRSPDSDAILSELFGFHSLAIEDVYNDRHRPKIEDYDSYLYIIFRGLGLELRLEDVETIELDLFLGHNFVVTHHNRPLESIAKIQAELTGGTSKLLEGGPVFLAHAILDRMVDRYMPLAELYEQEISTLERAVLGGGDPLLRIVDLKGGLQRFRRVVVAHRDLTERLARAEFDEIPAEAKPFFRDVHEHLGQLTEQLEDHRLDLNAVFDAFHSLSAHRMNEIMKVLTLISTIMLPLTFLVGVYGMNFKHMPELEWQWGYAELWGLMVAIAAVQLLYFRRRGWL